MKKKVISILLLLFFISFFNTCYAPEDECFSISTILLENYSLNGNMKIKPLDTVDINDYAIAINCGINEEICFNLDFGNSLYAIKLVEPFYILQNKIKNISIKSNSDLNDNYYAGSELKTLFTPIELSPDCVYDNYDCIRDYSKFEGIDSIEDAFNELFAINEYLSKNTERIQLINLFSINLNESVSNNTHKFTITFELENGQIITSNTNEILIK